MSFKFERLQVWKSSIAFADEMLTIADSLPKKYQFSLSDQLRRASLSIPTNIAEGTGRDSMKEQAYFYRIAKGSLYEVVSLLVMINRRNLLDYQIYQTHYKTADTIAAMLSGLIRHKTAN